LENIIVVMLTPKWILRNSPFKLHRDANESYIEWGKYMREMYDNKRSDVKKGETQEGMDLMGALVKGAGITADSLNEQGNGDPEKAAASLNKQLLTDDEILGNAFVFILAGHETAANTVHFSILFLAMHWSSQKRLQEDLDAILGDKPVSEWDYDNDVPKLFGSMCGAVMNEELRLIPPVIGIPKSTPPGRPQGLQLGGNRVTVPQNCMVTLNTAALHRNPKYWPHTSDEDLLEFRPERWLLDPTKSHGSTEDNAYAEEEGLDFDGPDKRPDTAASLYRPPKGAYVPFSDGYRSCLGRRFAQVEILAVLAVIFKTWSVELDVGAYMTDEEVATASEDEKRKAWGKADANARDLLRNGMMTIITIQMRKDKVPLRFVKRGSERFKFG
jgi:cytochrome P450